MNPFSILIAVTYQGEAVVVMAPEEYLNKFDSDYCADMTFEDYPTNPGIYRCQVRYVPGDDEDRYVIVESREVAI